MAVTPAESRPEATDQEELARFLMHSNHYTASTGRVSARAFTLPKNETTLPIYRTTGLTPTDRWTLADACLASICDWPDDKQLQKDCAAFLAARAARALANVTIDQVVGLEIGRVTNLAHPVRNEPFSGPPMTPMLRRRLSRRYEPGTTPHDAIHWRE